MGQCVQHLPVCIHSNTVCIYNVHVYLEQEALGDTRGARPLVVELKQGVGLWAGL